MCELLGMSANVPTDIRFSFAGLARRGGETGPHGDGWGIAFYEGRGCRSFHDPEASARSEIARLIRQYPIKSRIVVAHVRRANRGRVALENTHPFSRELWGRTFTFAHNGQLKGVKRLALGRFRPVGTTDSEHAFCWMLGRLEARWKTLPRPTLLDGAVRALAAELHGLGVFNMLLTDSRTLYAHCGKRLCYLTRRAPFGTATLIDEDWRVDFSEETTPHDIVTVVATQPLTRDERWIDLPPGTVLAFRLGVPDGDEAGAAVGG
ncbi:class II glutamine amidotransferase [Methylobacterium isbiliense]|jgi:glutamine amidotransferase|uniref:Glutamine amidotransferase YafJ n=1 Tax=Methylobacterium isbiliense TaxID=315478 RepID=A0ABQ4SPB9_9HYPH|nr:class II glutamine amidotransferase [Methylobacterium isbiliense]MDN3624384.1 class II glutamine amidotransferase [Methylobacterium isbiliense]GJE04354.1 Putative glutamine amidotransferase YafJ [Methylobacterium isbiliense]